MCVRNMKQAVWRELNPQPLAVLVQVWMLNWSSEVVMKAADEGLTLTCQLH